MNNKHHVHDHHSHQHNLSCGHAKIKHGDHIDYVHNGHLHHEHEGHWDECSVSITDTNPDICAPMNCGCQHNSDCGHELVPHGDHVDYLVNGHLHHVHGGHCDDHGPVELVMVK